MCVTIFGFNFGQNCNPQNKSVTATNDTLEAVTKYLVSNTNIQSQRIQNDQSITFTNNGIINCGDESFTIDQVISGTYTFNNNVDNQTVSDIQNILSAIVSQTTSQEIKELDDFLSQQGTGVNSATLMADLQEIIKNEINIDNINEAMQSAYNSQIVTMINNGTITGDGCNIDQNTIANVTSANILSNVEQAIIDNQDFLKLSQSTRQLNFSISLGPLSIFIIIALIIGAIIIIGLIIFGIYELTKPKNPAQTSIHT